MEPPAPQPTSTAVAERKPAGLRGLIEGEAFVGQISKSLPRHLTPERFVRVAVTAMNKTPKLRDCDPSSFCLALLTLSQLGLEPDGRNAHLIPFENRKKGIVECQLIIDYKGLVELVMRSGLVSNIHADAICENDVFEYDCGEIKAHKIDFRKPRGAAYAFYARATFKDGSVKSEVMTLDEVKAIQARSRAGQSGPWVTDFSEMAKKTVFRRLSKWLPISSEFKDALEKDGDQLEEKRVENAVKIGFASVQTVPTPAALPVESDMPQEQEPMSDNDGGGQ